MKKIGLEITRANKDNKTGTEWYAWHLFKEFKELDINNKFYIYFNNDLAEKLREVPINFYLKRLHWPFKKFWTHIRLSIELVIHPVDKFFAANALPLLSRGEIILTVHDLGFLRNPELYHPLERIYQKISHILAIKRAHKIIAISKNTKKDIIHYFPKVKNKIRVIYNGYDHNFFKVKEEKIKKEIKKKYNLPNKYILYIGRLETKKNIQNLIKAYQLIKNKNIPLILGGRPGNYGYEEIKKLSRNKKNIIFLGYIPQEDYQLLLASAFIFIFPSKFEGFGIPIVEAMASGVPVICSNIPVFKEITENNVFFFNPDDIEDISKAIDRVIEDKELRKDLIKKSLKQVKKFSWHKCAQETLEYILE